MARKLGFSSWTIQDRKCMNQSEDKGIPCCKETTCGIWMLHTRSLSNPCRIANWFIDCLFECVRIRMIERFIMRSRICIDLSILILPVSWAIYATRQIISRKSCLQTKAVYMYCFVRFHLGASERDGN